MTSFLGINLLQNWNDFPLWEEFFNQNPLRAFIEIGTGAGGMTIYFALQCRQRGIIFHTFDHQQWLDFESELPKLLNLKDCFHHCNIFSDDGKKKVIDIIQDSPKPLVIFFDNGNKPNEWQSFASLTLPGDFCIVHDYETEFLLQDIGDVLVERIQLTDENYFRELKTAFFKRVMATTSAERRNNKL